MNLTMVPVTADNREEISRLHVAAGQESYIETVPQCLREAEEEEMCIRDRGSHFL